MAVTAIKNPSGLKMKFDCGKDENGKAIRKTKTYSNLRPDAIDQDVYDVGVMIASLQQNTLIEIVKADDTTIAE